MFWGFRVQNRNFQESSVRVPRSRPQEQGFGTVWKAIPRVTGWGVKHELEGNHLPPPPDTWEIVGDTALFRQGLVDFYPPRAIRHWLKLLPGRERLGTSGLHPGLPTLLHPTLLHLEKPLGRVSGAL